MDPSCETLSLLSTVTQHLMAMRLMYDKAVEERDLALATCTELSEERDTLVKQLAELQGRLDSTELNADAKSLELNGLRHWLREYQKQLAEARESLRARREMIQRHIDEADYARAVCTELAEELEKANKPEYLTLAAFGWAF